MWNIPGIVLALLIVAGVMYLYVLGKVEQTMNQVHDMPNKPWWKFWR